MSRLIQIWVAEGFLKLDDKCKSLEDKAEKYLEDLVKRNLVLVVLRKSNGKIKSCRLHDVVREMTIRKANEEKFLLHVTERHASPEITKDFRCINLVDCNLKDILCPTIRSILSQRGVKFKELDLLGNFRLLRVLDAINGYEKLMPSQVFELTNLRFLSFVYIVRIPSSISNLKNLQTLLICLSKESHPAYLSSLPLEIWSMPQLKHLVFSHSYVFS